MSYSCEKDALYGLWNPPHDFYPDTETRLILMECYICAHGTGCYHSSGQMIHPSRAKTALNHAVSQGKTGCRRCQLTKGEFVARLDWNLGSMKHYHNQKPCHAPYEMIHLIKLIKTTSAHLAKDHMRPNINQLRTRDNLRVE